MLSINSALIGILFALITAKLTKQYRSLQRSPVFEIIIVFTTGLISYQVSELLAQSAIITLLANGIVLAHYAWYNLSSQSKQLLNVSVESLGFLAEAFVFVYIGITGIGYNDQNWSVKFIVIEIIIITVG